ncbi:MAG: hypothetical protein N2253_03565 [Bacteroidia bacterium]|nr:hypothetical protein [Bacteroidia bacterium]MCX7763958.1 hypothetical protein [Bacteroidia bacterium]MDW8057151.1 DUF6580 family putative transport protein [Bacteroidia bacterium]
MWKSILLALLLVGVGVVGRMLPHPPNFTPIEAIALFGGAWFSPIWLSLLLPITIMAITDLLLGWHSLWPFTWGAMGVGALVGRYLMEPLRFFSVAGAAVLQATIFFLLTNFGVWVKGYYGYSLSGLASCYLAAIPFYHYQVMGALTYSTIFWGVSYAFYHRFQLVRR